MYTKELDDDLLEDIDDEIEDELACKYLMISIGNEKYAIELIYINEIMVLPNVTKLPDSPEWIRGAIKLRKNILPLIDLRCLFGKPSIEEEDNQLIELLNQRKLDHVNWLNELNKSVSEKREFTLTTNPHECAFGRWYDNYKSANNELSYYLNKFDAPHKRIHGIAVEIKELIRRNCFNEAISLIEETRGNELTQMITLFNDFGSHIKSLHKELAIIYEYNEKLKAFSADRVDEIVEILPENIQQMDMVNRSPYIKGVGNVKDIPCVLLDIYKMSK